MVDQSSVDWACASGGEHGKRRRHEIIGHFPLACLRIH